MKPVAFFRRATLYVKKDGGYILKFPYRGTFKVTAVLSGGVWEIKDATTGERFRW